MYRDVFTKLSVDLNSLDPNELVIVTYDKLKHNLIFRQLNKVIIASYLSPFFFPKKNFKMGALTPAGMNKLRYNLTKLLGNSELDKDELIPDIRVFGTSWYKCYNSVTLPTPQEFVTLDYVNIRSRFLTWITCKLYNNNSRIAYKSVINERKLNKQKSKQSN